MRLFPFTFISILSVTVSTEKAETSKAGPRAKWTYSTSSAPASATPAASASSASAPASSGAAPTLAAPASDSAGGRRDTAGGKTHIPPETCKEIYARIKRSDCAKPVARFLEGASLMAGVAFNSGDMRIDSDDTTVASLIGILVPAPYFGFSLPKSYFGASGWGYEFTFAYTSSIAVYQDLGAKSRELRDLGSYAAITFLSVSPSVFLSVGARDDDPDKYWRYGLGVGAGWASLRGEAYHVHDSRDSVQHACHEAAARLREGGISEAAFRDACEPRSFVERGLGLSTAAFTDFRWGFFYGKLSTGGLTISSSPFEFKPLEVSIKFAYIQDL